MLIAHYADDVVAWAPAKVNLYLEVLSRRADGFHELETLMAAVSLYDTLVFKEDPTGDILLRCNRPDLSTGSDNLIRRAAELLRQHTGCTRGARVRLVKRIPLAAGLAGGSTDAAATLAGLNRLWSLGLTNVELAALGARLGSDVPFFLRPRPPGVRAGERRWRPSSCRGAWRWFCCARRSACPLRTFTAAWPCRTGRCRRRG